MMRKRILSILLCLVMVAGLFPTMAFAADGSGATTGSGTKRDPYCVSTYAEMKRLLETPASYYIKVVGMDNDATNDGVPVHRLIAGRDFESKEPAIDIPYGANHHLEIATKIWFITDPMDGDKNIFGRLIDVERGSSLEITGTGSLRVEVNTLVATNAIICNWGGELTIDGSVVLSGIQNFTSNVATRPIFINGGVTNIKGGYIYGHNNMTAINDGVTSAIHFGETLAEGTALNISGGTIRQYNNEINQENENSCALYVKNDTAAIHLTGGTFEGGMKMKMGKPLSNLLVAGYQFNDMSTNTVFDGSVSKTQKALVVTPAGVDTTIINNVSLTVKKSPNERKTLSDFDCSYTQNNKMVLDNFGVYPGLNSTSKEIKDHNTQYDSSADYTVMYVFKKKDGFSFSSDVEKHVTVSGGEFWKADQMGGKKGLLRVFVNFPSSSNPNRVKEVSMTMKSKGDFKTIEDLKCQSFTPADKLELVNQAFYMGLKDTSNANEITNLTAAYQPAADYTGVYVFKLKSGFSFAQDITDLAKKHVTISEGEIYSMDTMTDTDGAYLLRVFVSFEGTGSRIEKVTLNTPTRNEINQAASSVGFMPTSYTPSEKMSYGLQVMVGLDQDGTGPSLEDGKFDAKQDYSVRYNLQPKDGFAFAEGFSAKDVTVSNGTVYKVEMSGKDCYVYVNFPAKAAEGPNYVTEAAVQVAAVAGEIPSINGITVTSSNADKIKKALVLWSNTSTPFVAGQEYSTTVYLEPKEGVTFADDMKLNVNGKVVNLAKKDPNGSVQFLVKITAVAPSTGPNYVTEAAVQVAAVAGEIPSINGITVTSSNADKIKKALVLWSNTSTPFVAGQEYSTTVYLEPKEGVTFADDMKLNVNGKVVNLAKKDPNGSVQFLVKITAVAPSAPTTYAIKVTSGGNGKASASPDKAAAETTITLTAKADSGYHFKEWRVVKGGVTITDNKFKMPAGDVEIKAIFEKDAPAEYTVKFDGNGGKASKDEMTTNNQKLAKLPDATRSGKYQFDGWYMKKDGGTKITTATVFDKNTTVYAHWTYTGGGSSGGGGGGGSSVTTYAITVKSAKNGTVTASHKSAAKDTAVTLTVTPDKGYVLDTLTVLDSKDKAVKLIEKNGKYTFTMPAGKVTVSAAFKAAAPASENPFTDVPSGAYYEDAVVWAVKKGITSGTSATTFNPDGSCTRAQAVTFLWRAAGSPEPKSAAMPFTDVPAGSYFEKAVLWAVENGITKGTSDTTFTPDASCTRAQIVTFLWRANGSHAVSGNSAFSDVAADAYYAAAVAWAEKNGVTGGIGGGLFGSDNTCTRAQIVTFLHRAMK